MLFEVKTLHGMAIHALDGEVGHVDELLFDDESWTARYVVVETGGWLSSKKVLLSPLALGFLDWDEKILHLNLTREKIQNSPSVETDQPVSRQWESGYYDYYAWPYYWGVGSNLGVYGSPQLMLAPPDSQRATDTTRSHDDDKEHDHASAHLRSTKEVTGYGISAKDGHIGHVEDFLIDIETWQIAFLAVDTKDWLPGKKVQLPIAWIDHVTWRDRSVTVHATQAQIKDAPEWDKDTAQ